MGPGNDCSIDSYSYAGRAIVFVSPYHRICGHNRFPGRRIDMIDLQNKVAFITGGARGIGRGCALEMARCGADIVIYDKGNREAAAETVEMIRHVGGEAIIVVGDVTGPVCCGVGGSTEC